MTNWSLQSPHAQYTAHSAGKRRVVLNVYAKLNHSTLLPKEKENSEKKR